MANGAMLRRVGRPASIGPLSTLHPYQEDSHRRVEYRRSTKVDKAQGQAPIPQGAWRSTICEDPLPKNKKQPQRRSPKPRQEASARIPPSQESHRGVFVVSSLAGIVRFHGVRAALRSWSSIWASRRDSPKPVKKQKTGRLLVQVGQRGFLSCRHLERRKPGGGRFQFGHRLEQHEEPLARRLSPAPRRYAKARWTLEDFDRPGEE